MHNCNIGKYVQNYNCTYRIWWGNLKRQLGRLRRSKRIILKMDHKEISCKGVDWINLAHDKDKWRAVLNTVM